MFLLLFLKSLWKIFLQETLGFVSVYISFCLSLTHVQVTNLRRVTMMILDEADRMFDMGFEPQVNSIHLSTYCF